MNIENNEIKAEHLHFDQSCHSVEDAAKAVDNLFGKGVDQKEFVKNICLVDAEGNLIVAIVKREYRVDIKRVSELVGKKIKIELVITLAELFSLLWFSCQ